MSKIRINDLARELEVKSKAILDVLTEVGVTEKKTHSSSLEEDEAEKVRVHLQGSGNGQSAKSARAVRPDADGVKPKIDLSQHLQAGRCAEGDPQPSSKLLRHRRALLRPGLYSRRKLRKQSQLRPR